MLLTSLNPYKDDLYYLVGLHYVFVINNMFSIALSPLNSTYKHRLFRNVLFQSPSNIVFTNPLSWVFIYSLFCEIIYSIFIKYFHCELRLLSDVMNNVLLITVQFRKKYSCNNKSHLVEFINIVIATTQKCH